MDCMGRHTAPNGLPSQFSDVVFRQLTAPNSSVSQVQSENGGLVRSPTAPGGSMKRRNSSLANCEKMLQGMNATSNVARPRQRKGNVRAHATILEFAEKEGENRAAAQSVDESWDQESANQSDRFKKPEDPNQALLQYFAKLSSSADVDDSLDLGHIQSLLREGASVNTSDRFGQTLLHEVARSWGVDVAQFFFEQGKTTKS